MSEGQELISKRSCEDDDHAELEEGEVVVGFAVAAGGDAAHCFQPGVGAFDGPAVTCLWVAGFRQPARFDYEVKAAAGRASERARDLLAPLFASTSEASTITRDQSSLSAPASCCCSTRIAR